MWQFLQVVFILFPSYLRLSWEGLTKYCFPSFQISSPKWCQKFVLNSCLQQSLQFVLILSPSNLQFFWEKLENFAIPEQYEERKRIILGSDFNSSWKIVMGRELWWTTHPSHPYVKREKAAELELISSTSIDSDVHSEIKNLRAINSPFILVF